MRNIFKFIVIIFLIIIISIPNASGETITIEADSMSHGPEPSEEALDQGDVVEIVKISSRKDIITYVQGKEKGYKTFGSYGDVIIYNKNGINKGSPVIHRPVVWIEYNASGSNKDPHLRDYGSFDIPSMRLFNVTRIVIDDYIPNNREISIDLIIILRNFNYFNIEPHGGFITKGDNHIQCDQISDLKDSQGKPIEPVKIEWIKGKAEKPWFVNIFLTIGLIVFVIIIIVIIILIVYFKSKRTKKKGKIGPDKELKIQQQLTQQLQQSKQNRCSTCGLQKTYIQQNNRFYCYHCQKYE